MKLWKSSLVTFAAVALTACASLPEEEVLAAELWFPPRFKRIEEPRFCFGLAERERALRAYRDAGADTLFEFVVDADGEVEKARLVRTHVRREYHEDMEAHARGMVFSPDPEGGASYRAFYFPVRYRRDMTFEWL